GGDNVLMGGTTDYDQNLTALNLLMAEFVRTDEGFDQRANNIRRGQGLLAGSGIHLDRDTVHADLAPDALWGGAGQNWFFVDSADTINGGAGAGANDRVTHVS